MLADLESAAASIDGGSSPLGGADLIYGGDMDKWKKLANSLRLRMYMRLSEVDPVAAEQGISDIIDGGDPILESHADNAEMYYLPNPSNNPVNNFARTREDHKISRTMVAHLNELNDPRLRIYSVPVRNQAAVSVDREEVVADDRGLLHQGVRNGSTHLSLPLDQASTIGHYFMAPRSPGRIMTYSEVLFIRAEAAARGWTNEPAGDLYDQAVESALSMYDQNELDMVLSDFPGDVAFNHQGFNAGEFPEGISEDETGAYLGQSAVQWNNGEGWTENNQRLLATQKWIALYGQGLEAWFEWRRLGFPEIEPGPNAVLDEVPRRLTYPVLEQSLNNSNRGEAVNRLTSGDRLTTRVWWNEE